MKTVFTIMNPMVFFSFNILFMCHLEWFKVWIRSKNSQLWIIYRIRTLNSSTDSDLNQSDKDLNQIGQDFNQTGQDLSQGGHDLNQYHSENYLWNKDYTRLDMETINIT